MGGGGGDYGATRQTRRWGEPAGPPLIKAGRQET